MSLPTYHFRHAANVESFSTEKRPRKTVLRERCGTERSPDYRLTVYSVNNGKAMCLT